MSSIRIPLRRDWSTEVTVFTEVWGTEVCICWCSPRQLASWQDVPYIVSLMACYAMCKYASAFMWPVEKTPRMGNDSLRHCLPMLQFTHPLLDCIGLGEVGPSVDLCHNRAKQMSILWNRVHNSCHWFMDESIFSMPTTGAEGQRVS